MISGPKSSPSRVSSSKSSHCWDTTETWEQFVNSIHRVVRLRLTEPRSFREVCSVCLFVFPLHTPGRINSTRGSLLSSWPSEKDRRGLLKLMIVFPCSLAAHSFVLPSGIVFHMRSSSGSSSDTERLPPAHAPAKAAHSLFFFQPVLSAVLSAVSAWV